MDGKPGSRKRDVARDWFREHLRPKPPPVVPLSTASSPGTTPAPVAAPSPGPAPSPGAASPEISNVPRPRRGFSEDALGTLAADDQLLVRKHLAENAADAARAVDQAYAAAISQRQTCEDRAWRVHFRGREVVLREQADRVVNWIERFKSVGDVVANVDPVHIGLPWAGIRFILEVAVAGSRQRAALLSGIDMAMYMANRLGAYSDYLEKLPRSDTTATFEKTLVRLYASVLRFLVDAVDASQKRSAARVWELVWQGSDLDRFETRCQDWSIQVDIDASNCERVGTSTWREDLRKSLQNLEEIREIRTTLATLQYSVDLTRLATAHGATYNSYEEERLATCLEGTRVDLIQRIGDWAHAEHSESIFWLKGMAGTGKSTISRTMARQFEREGLLGASFFFKRGEGDRGNASRFFPTIAVQLADVIPGLGRFIAAAIEADNLFSGKGLKTHFEKLVLHPLQTLSPDEFPSAGIVIVIDAMDECQRSEDIRTLLKQLAEVGSIASVRLRVFVTSRPELPMRLGFKSMPGSFYQDIVLEEVQENTIEHDIRAYLETQFVEIRQTASDRWPHHVPLPTDWPGASGLDELVRMSKPLFIFASTICLFVSESNPRKRLAKVLEPRRGGQSSVLESTYTPILEHVVLENDAMGPGIALSQFRKIVGPIVVLYDSLSVRSLGNLLEVDADDVGDALENLHSVLDIPEDRTEPVRLLHKSFRDFLVDPGTKDRNTFWIDEVDIHKRLSAQCLCLLSRPGVLREDICNVQWPGCRRTEISKDRISRYIVGEVAYACSYWIPHLSQSGDKICDGGPVHNFLELHFLCWLEARSWLGTLSDVVLQIKTLQSLVDINRGSELSSFLDDAYRLALRYRQIIDLAPLQTYSSAIVFTPDRSIVRKGVAPKHPIPWLRLSPDVPSDWSAEIQILEGHGEVIIGVAFSPDGQLLASGSDDDTVRIWDSRTGEEIRRIGCDHVIDVVVFSSDGMLAIATAGGYFQLWDTSISEKIQTFQFHGRWTGPVAISHDGRWLASTHVDETIRKWDITTGKEIWRITCRRPTTIAFSPDGQVLASTFREENVQIRDAATGKEIRQLRKASATAFCPDGRLLMALGDEGFQILDNSSGEELRLPRAKVGYVEHITVSPDGKMFASISDGSDMHLWSIGGEKMLEFCGHYGDLTYAIAFSPDGQTLASGSEHGTIRIWSTKVAERIQPLYGNDPTVVTVAFSPDGQTLASGSEDGTVRTWSTKASKKLQEFYGDDMSVDDTTFSPGVQMLGSGSEDWRCRARTVETGEEIRLLREDYMSPGAVVFSPNGQILVSGTWDGGVRVWSIKTREEILEFCEDDNFLGTASFSPDGQMLVSASREGRVRMWSTKTGKIRREFRGADASVKTAAFSSDGQMLALGSWDGRVRVWSVKTGEKIREFYGANALVETVAFSSDGQMLASGSQDEIVRIYSVKTGEELQKLDVDDQKVETVTFSADGQMLASGSYTGTIQIWSVKTGEEMHSSRTDIRLGRINFSSDNSFLGTDAGDIDLRHLSQTQSSARSMRRRVFGLDGTWIQYAGRDLLWLPPEYRGHSYGSSAVFGEMLAIGQRSGATSFFKFDAQELDDKLKCVESDEMEAVTLGYVATQSRLSRELRY